jgi:hypothetical protein
MFVKVLVPSPIFDEGGNRDGYEDVEITVLEGVTLNGHMLDPEDFDSRGRLVA